MLPSRLFDLYYGAPASGKSEAAQQVIRQMHKETGKKARVIVGDGSLMTYESLIASGVVEATEFSQRPWPTDVVPRLAEGWFPADPSDYDSPLVDISQQPSFKDIGMYVFEGVSVMAQYVMGHIKGGLAWQSAQGVKLGQDTPFEVFNGIKDAQGKLKEGPGTKVGGNPQSHYNIAQGVIVGAVQRSKGLSRYVLWTAHEATNNPEKDVLMKELIVGPEVVGKALTASFQKIMGNTFHFQTVAKRSKEKDETTGRDTQTLTLDYRIYPQDHFSPDNNTMIRYKAVTRGVRGLKSSYNDIMALYNDIARINEENSVDRPVEQS